MTGKRQWSVNIPKSRSYVRPSDLSEKKTKLVASLGEYTLHNTCPLPIKTIKRADLLLPYKVYEKKQEKKNNEHSLTINIYDKYKVASTELKSRLYAEDSKENICAVTDVDKDFYRCIEAHKLPKHAPLFKSLKYPFNQYMRIRQQIGYINDCTLNIDVLQRKEKEIYNRSVHRYMEQVKYLDNFILLDYKKSIACLNECDNLSDKLNKKELELRHFAAEKFTIISRLISLDYSYGLQQKYGRFLYYLSPPSWRLSHRDFARSIEIEARGFDFSCSSEEDNFNVIFEKMKHECYSGLVKPVLYFTHPSDLIDIFSAIEKNQLYNLSYVIYVEPRTKALRKCINSLKDKIEVDSAAILSVIKQFESSLQYHLNKSSDLKTIFFKILKGTFYDSIAVADVLKLKLHLEFAYEKWHSEKPLQMDIMMIAKALEKKYMDYSKKIDDIYTDKVKLAVIKCMEAERTKMNKAKFAARELLLFNRLQRDLFRAHAFVNTKSLNSNYQNATKSIQMLEKPMDHWSKPKIIQNKQKALIESEREYLTLFTDWNEKDDPINYLH